MNANFYVGCILARFSGQTHRVRSWTYARFHYEPSTDGPQPLFLETCDFKQQLLSLPRERAQAGKVSEWMQKVGSARLGRAFALLRAIINNDPYEDYKIITPILIPRYLSGGSDWNALLRLAPFGPRSWITSIGPECYSHVMRNIVNTIWKGRLMSKSVCFQENEPICCLCCDNLFCLFSPRVAAVLSGDETLVETSHNSVFYAERRD